MSNQFNTAFALGAKAPFILVMKLEPSERAIFIAEFSPQAVKISWCTVRSQ